MSHLETVVDALRRIKPELVARYHVRDIGVFGSIVRDDFLPETSDIDVVVDFAEPIGIEFVDVAELLESVLKRKVDLVSRKGIKPKYLQAIESEILYV
jgi:hypothetical protein